MIAAFAIALAFAAGPQSLPDWSGKPTIKPAEVVLACADANFGVRKLRWTGWGGSFAAATGVAYANDCTPTCVAGHMHTYQAVLVAAGSQICPGGRRSYNRVTVAFVGPSPYPKSKPADLTYRARCR